MQKIIDQRKGIVATLVGTAIFVHGVVIEYFPKFAEYIPLIGSVDNDIVSFVKLIISSGSIYTAIVFLPVWLYDTWLWKIINPKFDLTGSWFVSVEKIDEFSAGHLTRKGIIAAKEHRDRLTTNNGIAEIAQTPFRLWVQTGVGFAKDSTDTSAITWRAEGVAVNLPGSLSIVFEGADGGEYSGRDYLHVIERDWRGRPTLLLGNAFHVASDSDLVYRGQIIYKRLKGKATTFDFLLSNSKNTNK